MRRGDPKRLVFGSPGRLRSTAGHLKDFQKAFDSVARGLRGVGKGSLKGRAADAFWEKVGLEPAKWVKAADACEKAAGALEDFAGTVEWAQGQAREAVAKYEDGRKKAAQEQLEEARAQRDEAAGRARTAVGAARDAAPPKPSYAEQAGDGLTGLRLDATHLSGGVVKGVAGLNNFVRSVNPVDPYNLTHPAEYVTSLNSTVTGIARVANDPVGTGKQMWETFRKDPSEGVGRLLPELLGTKGVGMATKAGRAGKLASELSKARKAVRTKGKGPSSTPPKKKCANGTDPVDLATGLMFLPQTDLTLPGALPLAFTRHIESGYRLGRWFGPSWASTVDQRLEVGPEGVVFVAEDGRLLEFPHPAPGLPTCPSAGASRMPLERTQDGGYTLTEPETGWVRHFAPPQGEADFQDGAAAGANGVCRLEQITDRNGHFLVFEYEEESGAPSRLVHSGGYEVRLTVEDDRVTALSLVDGDGDGVSAVMRYGYTDGNLTGVVNSSGLPLRFEYDDDARVISWTDTNGRRYDYVYDNVHRVIAEGGTAGHMQVRIDYDGRDSVTGHKVTTLTSAAGHATRTLFDEHGQAVGEIDALGHRTRTERDAFNRPLSHTDALGHTTRFTYDEAGRLATITRPDAATVTITRNALGLPLATTDPDGAVWRQEWDEHGNRTALTDPAGHTTHYSYDTRGHLSTVTDPLGASTHVRCDGAGLPVEITDPLGATTRYERDAFGRPVRVTDPLGACTTLAWTVEGRLSSRTTPDGARECWEWDGEGNCTRHTDAAGGETTYSYTHFDMLESRTTPDGVRYTFTYDAELRLTQVTSPHGLTWDYTYDPAGRLTAETDFDNRTQHYTLDPTGQLVRRTTPLGETITHERDTLGRTVRKNAAGKVTTYAYDPAGRLLEAAGPDTELRYQRDRLGRIKTELVNDRVLTHTYDALGRRTRRVTPTGAVSTSTYDPAGNRTSLTASGHTLDFTHDAAGRETERRIGPQGLTLAQIWDPAGRLTAQSLTTHPPTAPSPAAPSTTAQSRIQHREYEYRPDGYLTSVNDHLGGQATFDLDATGRVTAVHAQGWSERYAYDETGNQTEASWPATHAAPEAIGPRTYSGTAILTAGKVRYEHDAAGRITLRQKTRLSKKPDTWHYTWDAEDRLTQVTTPDGTTWHYAYDPLGRRTTKHSPTLNGWTSPGTAPPSSNKPPPPPHLSHPVSLTWDHDGFTPLTQTERLTDDSTQQDIDSRFYAIVTDLVGTPTEFVSEQGEITWHTRPPSGAPPPGTPTAPPTPPSASPASTTTPRPASTTTTSGTTTRRRHGIPLLTLWESRRTQTRSPTFIAHERWRTLLVWPPSANALGWETWTPS